MSIKILIAEDNAFLGDAMRHTLSRRSSEYEVIGLARNRLLALELALKHTPDIIFMDLEMPEMGGLQATKEILRILPETYIVGMSLWPDKTRLIEMKDAGARGYVVKNADIGAFRNAIEAVRHGKEYLCPSAKGLFQS